jgi:multiple sugar transport system permease protein
VVAALRSVLLTFKSVFLYGAMCMSLFLFLFPLFWLFRTGGLKMGEIFSLTTYWFPQRLTNYLTIWNLPGIQSAYLHSIIISAAATMFTVGLAIPVGFSLARLSTGKAAGNFLDSLLVAIALPPVVLLIPFYILMSRLGLVDTMVALIIMNMVFNLPFTVWLVYSFFKDLPIEVEEAGMIDGCSRLGAFMRLSIPMSITGLAVAAILVFIASWNELLYAMVLTQRNSVTATVAILDLVLGRGGGGAMPSWDQSSAAGIWFMLPTLIFALLMNKYLVRALTLGAVKR